MSTVTARGAAFAVLAAVLTACASPPAPEPAPAQWFPPLPDPVTACTDQLVYWAGEQLRGAPDQGFDYQHMGLTSAQADALAVVVERARAQGPETVPGLAREACTALTAGPPTAPWGT